MPRHFAIIPARFDQGHKAYEAGHDLAALIKTANEIDLMHDAEGVTTEQHEEIAASIPSLFAGYASGVIDDIRSIVSSPSLTRRGQRA